MKRILLLMMTPVLLILATGCEQGGPQIDLESSIPVKVEELQPRSIKEYVFATGTIEAVTGGQLQAFQQGTYRMKTNPRTRKPYAMGDKVSNREVIVSLYNPEFEFSVALDSKKLNFDISKREYEKQQKLYEKGGVTLRELTDAQSQYINAKYALDNAELQLIKLTVMSPCDGIITDLPFHAYDELIVTGTILGSVMDYNHLYTDITLPGKDMARIKTGQDVIVSNYGEQIDSIAGKIVQVSPVLDPDSRMFKARVSVGNPDNILRPGMFVKANIIVAQKDSALVIPKDVIIDRHGSKVVYAVEKGIASEREIEIGLSNRDEVEAISGLNADDRLVVEGYETLRNRSKVKIIK